MLTDNSGHYVNLDGDKTAPQNTPYWIGNDIERVAFDYLLLDDGRVAIHALYGNATTLSHEECFYGYTSPHKSVAVVCGLVDSVRKFLKSRGALDSDYGFEFISDIADYMGVNLTIGISNPVNSLETTH